MYNNGESDLDKQDVFSITENFFDVTVETSEVFIDSLLKDGILKDLPLVGILLALFKAGRKVVDIFYLKKLEAFIYGYEQLPEKINEKLSSEFEDEKKRKDLGEKILFIIENVDSTVKAKLIGKLLKLLKNGEIASTTFLRLCHLINKSFYDDLLSLKKFTNDDMILTANNDIIEYIILEELFSSGWLSELGFDGGDAAGNNSGTRYGLNSFAKIIIPLLP